MLGYSSPNPTPDMSWVPPLAQAAQSPTYIYDLGPLQGMGLQSTSRKHTTKHSQHHWASPNA